MLTITRKRQTGMSLIELMISITIGLIILAGVLTVFSNTVRSSTNTLKSSRLNQNMQAAMDIMVEDIRRAGYWDNTAGGAPDDNPFTDADNLNTATANCILYAYDRSSGGSTDGIVNNAERYGFKLNSGAVEMRITGTSSSDCGNGTWIPLTDSDSITINPLTFSTSFKCANVEDGTTVTTACTSPPGGTATGETLVETRTITVSMTGVLVGDSNVKKEITESIRVRNDRILTQP